MGRPKAKSGTKPPLVVALFAPSGAATPSMAPFPNSSGCFDTRFSTSYATKVVTAGAQPGRRPRKKPMPVERSIAPMHRLISLHLGIQSSVFVSYMRFIECSTFIMISLMAKRPIMTLMKLIPAIMSMEPKVRRAAPVRGFCPIREAVSPRAIEMTPLSSALPERLIIRLRPMNIRAKYSGGPKARAKFASTGAKKVSPTRLRVPAKKEDIADMARAGPARPCFAIA